MNFSILTKLRDGILEPRSRRVNLQKKVEQEVFAIGHSTRSKEEFAGLLKSNGITTVVDIRTIPKSRRNPQFDQDALSKYLEKNGIFYLHIKGLGGLRTPSKKSVNLGWRNFSFRGYADYMKQDEFLQNLDQLIELISSENNRKAKVAYMCAEAVPWRCHGSLVSDALTVRGLRVSHIISEKSVQLHVITPFARVRGMEITYPSSGKTSVSVQES